jgi:formate hydrogenlyase subunit 3/multisubunit Na+/H+ antiporter MnhD subunit
VKRVLAYSSIAHTGYMLVGLAALAAPMGPVRGEAIKGVLFYLAAYGIMNAGAFGVLMLLPARDGRGSAEMFEDLAGQGRRHVGLGLAMAVCCFSLIGIPLTVGFLGKLLIIKPALIAASGLGQAGQAENPVRAAMVWLVVITMINAAISAAYYLRIIATMFLRSDETIAAPAAAETTRVTFVHPGSVTTSTSTASATSTTAGAAVLSRVERNTWPILTAVVLSVVMTLVFGTIPPAADVLGARAQAAQVLEGQNPPNPAPPAGGGRTTAAR